MYLLGLQAFWISARGGQSGAYEGTRRGLTVLLGVVQLQVSGLPLFEQQEQPRHMSSITAAAILEFVMRQILDPRVKWEWGTKGKIKSIQAD